MPEDNGVVKSLRAGLDRDHMGLLVFGTFAEGKAHMANYDPHNDPRGSK